MVAASPFGVLRGPFLVKELAFEQRPRGGPPAAGAAALGGEFGLNRLEQGPTDDRLMLAY
jgi:hypothetical protein